MSGDYSRLYYKFPGEFPDVYADDAALAAWVRLLVLADASWPMRPPVPRSVRPSPLRKLVACGLVQLEGDSYRVLGLDKERSRRSAAAKHAADNRWGAQLGAERNAGRISDGIAESMPSRAEQSKDEQRRDEGARRADLDAFLAVRFRVPTPAQRDLMDAYCRVFDETGPERAAQLIYRSPDDPIGALKADLAAFRSERRREAEAQERPVARRGRRGTGMSTVNAELARMLEGRYALQSEHASGGHAGSPAEGCPNCLPVEAAS